MTKMLPSNMQRSKGCGLNLLEPTPLHYGRFGKFLASKVKSSPVDNVENEEDTGKCYQHCHIHGTSFVCTITGKYRCVFMCFCPAIEN